MCVWHLLQRLAISRESSGGSVNAPSKTGLEVCDSVGIGVKTTFRLPVESHIFVLFEQSY